MISTLIQFTLLNLLSIIVSTEASSQSLYKDALKTTSPTTKSSSTTLISPTSSSSIETDTLYTSFSTSALPVFNLFQPNKQYFDFIAQVGSPAQHLGMRVDVLQGDVWLPASSGFIACDDTQSTILPSATISYTREKSTQLSTQTDFVLSTSDSNTATTLSSSTISIQVNMVHTVFGQSCASLGIYDIMNSLYASFIDLYSQLEVAIDNATQYCRVYLSQIIVIGEWAVDTFQFLYQLGDKMKIVAFIDVPFINAKFSNVGVGSMALGISQTNYTYNYNFISNFVINQIIKTNSYSLALGAYNNTSPHLILGGVDLNLIDSNSDGNEGLMALFDFIPVLDESLEIVPLNNGLTNSIPAFPIFGWGVTSNSTGQSLIFSSSYNDRIEISTYPKPAIIDSRHYYNYIPYSTLIEMAVEFNAFYSSDLDRWLVDCSVGQSGTLDMFLGNYTVSMPISNFLQPANFNNTNLVFSSGDDACLLTFLPDYRIGFSLMGTSLLKSIYLAVDNENNKLAISQIKNLLEDYDINIPYVVQPEFLRAVNVEGRQVYNNEVSTKSSSQTSFVRTLSSVSKNSQASPIVFTSTATSTLSNQSLFLYETVITISARSSISINQSSRSFYAIESGFIPFASSFITITDMTLTVPTTVVFTDTLIQSNDIYISNGEIFAETIDGNDKTATGSKSTETVPIYAFSSLVSKVSKISSSAKPSAAGSNLRVPTIYRFDSNDGESYTSFKLFGLVFTMVLSITLLL